MSKPLTPLELELQRELLSEALESVGLSGYWYIHEEVEDGHYKRVSLVDALIDRGVRVDPNISVEESIASAWEKARNAPARRLD